MGSAVSKRAGHLHVPLHDLTAGQLFSATVTGQVLIAGEDDGEQEVVLGLGELPDQDDHEGRDGEGEDQISV